MDHIVSDKPRRRLNLKDESVAELQRAQDKAPDKLAFDAYRLTLNGWTAQDERGYQMHASACHQVIQDGEKLIAALEAAAEAQEARQERNRQAQERAQAKLAELAAQEKADAQRTQESAWPDVEPPATEEGDPGPCLHANL